MANIYQNLKEGFGIATGAARRAAVGAMPKMMTGMGNFERSVLEAMKRKKKVLSGASTPTTGYVGRNIQAHNKAIRDALNQ
jgi:hypothetical protein